MNCYPAIDRRADGTANHYRIIFLTFISLFRGREPPNSYSLIPVFTRENDMPVTIIIGAQWGDEIVRVSNTKSGVNVHGPQRLRWSVPASRKALGYTTALAFLRKCTFLTLVAFGTLVAQNLR